MVTGWVALALLLLLVTAEPLVKTLVGTTKVVVRNLPRVKPVPKAPVSPGWVTAGNVLAIVVAALLAALGAPGWTLLVPALATAPLTVVTTRHALRATAASQRIQRDTPRGAAGVRPGLRRLLRHAAGGCATSWACGCPTWSGWASRTW